MCLQTLQTSLAGVCSVEQAIMTILTRLQCLVNTKRTKNHELWDFSLLQLIFLMTKESSEDLKRWHFVLPLLNVCAVSGIKVFLSALSEVYSEKDGTQSYTFEW